LAGDLNRVAQSVSDGRRVPQAWPAPRL